MIKFTTAKQFYNTPRVLQDWVDEELIENLLTYDPCHFFEQEELKDIQVYNHRTIVNGKGWSVEWTYLSSVWFKHEPLGIWITVHNHGGLDTSNLYISDVKLHTEVVKYIQSHLITTPVLLTQDTLIEVSSLYNKN